jgi:hypothetical protein
VSSEAWPRGVIAQIRYGIAKLIENTPKRGGPRGIPMGVPGGLARGVDNFVFIALGTGIGAGIFVNGRIYRGRSGFAG